MNKQQPQAEQPAAPAAAVLAAPPGARPKRERKVPAHLLKVEKIFHQSFMDNFWGHPQNT